MLPLSVRALSKRYGAIDALRDVSFDAAPGEIFGLLGPNGAGKTTTLECILGLRRPDRAEIRVGDVDVLAAPEKTKQLIGALIQGAELQDKITPRQALRLFAGFYKNAAAPDQLIEQFSLEEKADAAFASLSHGQKQRLFLALAFVHQPQVVVLDEPTVGLDPRTRRNLHDLIRARRDEGKTIVLSTHFLDEAQQLCDRIAILDHGRIVALGTANELIERSRGLPRIVVRTTQLLADHHFTGLAGVTVVDVKSNVATLTTADMNASLVAVVGRLQASAIELLDLQVQRPTLEDVFLEVTGRPYSKEHDKGDEPK